MTLAMCWWGRGNNILPQGTLTADLESEVGSTWEGQTRVETRDGGVLIEPTQAAAFPAAEKGNKAGMGLLMGRIFCAVSMRERKANGRQMGRVGGHFEANPQMPQRLYTHLCLHSLGGGSLQTHHGGELG